jgi:tRNA-splicing endonuclease subunit Sen54
MPCGHNTPLMVTPSQKNENTPYEVFFHLYKPSTPFRKSAPPAPDFSIVVVKSVVEIFFCISPITCVLLRSARTTAMPTIYELSALFETQPELPPPLPRQRRQTLAKGSAASPSSTSMVPPPRPADPTFTQRLRQIFKWLFWHSTSIQPTIRRPNPFMALKAGKKNIVIAVVDSGNISFFRFGQGAFSEWPMV